MGHLTMGFRVLYFYGADYAILSHVFYRVEVWAIHLQSFRPLSHCRDFAAISRNACVDMGFVDLDSHQGRTMVVQGLLWNRCDLRSHRYV